MGRFASNGWRLGVTIILLWTVGGCGGKTKAGPPIFPGKVNLLPSSNTSLQLGGVLNFTASVQTASGTNISTPITYISSDTSVLSISPSGVACAGHWDAAYTTCTPGGTGQVTVTATALNSASPPTYVFVHPQIDSIIVKGILVNGVPVQEPCLSQTQSMTLEAHAYSQGSDITSSVGPFTFSANNPSVVNLIPIINSNYNFPTNQVTAKALTPGITQIFAAASGVSSTSFVQPQPYNGANLSFFETCPIQSIALSVGAAGSGQTSFVTAKGTSETIIAVVTDVMGNTSLPNTDGAIVLTKIPLTWTSSQTGVLGVASSCTESCGVTTASPGSGTITAACSPPTCNIGFPETPAGISAPFVPQPVYAQTAVSGVVTGTPVAASVLATSTGCAHEPPSTCSTSVYSFSTAKASSGAENPLPVSPNSLLFDPTGAKLYMGSDFGSEIINPLNFGTSNNPFTGLGAVTGNVLASSTNGNVAALSDTIHTPNQVYIVNSTNGTSTALNISDAETAAFSPDGLKTFIFGNGGTLLYVYSALQALQGPINLTGPVKNTAFSPNGAFLFAAEASTTSSSANITAFASCNNQAMASIPLPADPLLMRMLPGVHINGRDSHGYTIPDGAHLFVLDATGFDILTSTVNPPPAGTLCPQSLSFISNDPARVAQRVELGQGTLQPINFFASADGSQLYVLAAGIASILVYDFNVDGVTGIEIAGNATPVAADISVDGTTIVIAGSDSQVHEITTLLGGSDQVQLQFPSLPNYINPFCTFTPAQGNCSLDFVTVKP